MDQNKITGIIVDAALKIHQTLGPGLLESVYEILLTHELEGRGLSVERQKPIPLVYEGITFPDTFRADLVVSQRVLVELKSVEELERVHFKQLLTYLRISGLKVGLLINFNSDLLKNGVHRVVNGLSEQ